jgi:hypothetical protein
VWSGGSSTYRRELKGHVPVGTCQPVKIYILVPMIAQYKHAKTTSIAFHMYRIQSQSYFQAAGRRGRPTHLACASKRGCILWGLPLVQDQYSENQTLRLMSDYSTILEQLRPANLVLHAHMFSHRLYAGKRKIISIHPSICAAGAIKL